MSNLLPVAEALNIVLERASRLTPQSFPLGAGTLGAVLAEDIISDIDSPPFDKALMDGFAIRSQEGESPRHIIGELAAGSNPTHPLQPGQAIRIMTGAPIPTGADSVVPFEHTTAANDELTIVKSSRPGENILQRGREMKAGEVVLPTGTILMPQHFGILASVGRTAVLVHPSPEVGILSTGTELIEAGSTPVGGQIRNSNGPMLVAQTLRAGGQPRYCGIVPDAPLTMKNLIGRVLDESSVLVLSGGVSAGDYDLVPGILRELGVVAHFHKVALKPGKPLFFGTKKDTLVFGLPGNPVSSFVCFELFIRPAIAHQKGHRDPGPKRTWVPLASEFRSRSDRPVYHPAQLLETSEGRKVKPLPWFGSADLRALNDANALLVVPAGEVSFLTGQLMETIDLR